MAASFQEAVVDVLTAKAVDACRETRTDTLLVVGGVAANRRLREVAEQRCAAAGLELRVPSPALCTDNGGDDRRRRRPARRPAYPRPASGWAADPSALLLRSPR